MKTIVIDGIQYDLVPTKQEPEPLICTLDGVEYYLGPAAPFKMNWFTAVEWCKSLGPDYELPDRQVLLACYCNSAIKTNFSEYRHWSGSRSGSMMAWAQWFHNGEQNNCNLSGEFYVRAVRRQLL